MKFPSSIPWLSLRRLPGAVPPLIGLGATLIFFSIWPTPDGRPLREFFLSGDNFKFIAVQAAVVALGAVGMTLVLAGGGIDLSAGSNAAFSGIVAAVALRGGASPGVAILAALTAGAGAGWVNGSLVTSLKAAPFIVTLGTAGLLRGIAGWLAPEQSVPIPRTWLHESMAAFPSSKWLVVAPGVWAAALVAGAVALLLRNTVFGRHLVAVGSNETAAALSGVRVRFTKWLTYALAGLLFAMAGVLQMVRLRQGETDASAMAVSSLELDFLAAALLGGASLGGGRGSIPGSVAGALLLAVLHNGSRQAGWPQAAYGIMVAAAILGALGAERFQERWGTEGKRVE